MPPSPTSFSNITDLSLTLSNMDLRVMVEILSICIVFLENARICITSNSNLVWFIWIHWNYSYVIHSYRIRLDYDFVFRLRIKCIKCVHLFLLMNNGKWLNWLIYLLKMYSAMLNFRILQISTPYYIYRQFESVSKWLRANGVHAW